MLADFDLQPSLEKNAVSFSKTDGLTYNPLQLKKPLPSVGYEFFGGGTVLGEGSYS